MPLILQGLLIGLPLSMMIGPITFTILDSSLSKGWKAGVAAGIGMWISDIIYITLCYIGGLRVIHEMQNNSGDTWIGVIAGVVLLGIGLTLWFKQTEQMASGVQEALPNKQLAGHAARGFLVNSFSPFTMIFWPSITLTKVLNTHMDLSSALMFFGGILFGIMTGDTMKAVFAQWIRLKLSDRYIRYSRTVFALIFSGIGLYLIGRAVFALF